MIIAITFNENAVSQDIEELDKIFTQRNVPFYHLPPKMIISEMSEDGVGSIQKLPIIAHVEKIDAPYLLVSRKFHPHDSEITIDKPYFQKDSFTLIAGPCAVENKTMIEETAHFLSGLGITFLRGGTYKCRTSPYSFQGNGEESLEYLKEAGQKYSMKTVTEVLGEDLIEKISPFADILQIGSRNSQNFQLLKKMGMQKKPVLLKRGFMNTLQEFLLAAEYVSLSGNSNIILCERGIRTFENSTRNTLDIASIPLIRMESHLPIIVDPSHAAGRRDIVIALVKASMAAGALGAIVEVHPHPKKALSDGQQSLDFHEFEKLVSEVRQLAHAMNIQVQ